jgi:hypothetical protein
MITNVPRIIDGGHFWVRPACSPSGRIAKNPARQPVAMPFRFSEESWLLFLMRYYTIIMLSHRLTTERSAA